MSMIHEIIMREFKSYKKHLEKREADSGIEQSKRKNQEQKHLTARRGLKKLKKRIKDGEIICLKTD